MKFSLFRKQKPPAEPAKTAQTPEEPKLQTEVTAEIQPQEPQPEAAPIQPQAQAEVAAQEIAPQPQVEDPKPEPVETQSKTYLKAMPLKDLLDVESVKQEVEKGNIIILRVTPLANKSIEDVKTAVNTLYEFAESVGGDIARLGEERVVICPKNIRIWREKTPAQNNSLPTAAPTAA